MFTKKERSIYKYYNGEKMIGCDPMLVQMRLAKYTDWQNDIQLLKMANQESLGAYDRLTSAAREAFNVKAFKEVEDVQTGLLDQEVMELMVDFVNFVAETKKKLEEMQSKQSVGESESLSGEV